MSDAKPPTGAPLTGDYRKSLGKNYLGRWDLQAPDGRYMHRLVRISGVYKYTPPDHILRKQIKRAQKEGRGLKPEFEVRFDVQDAAKEWKPFRKGWIVRSEGLDSINDALREANVGKWIGREIVLFLDESVSFGREKVGGIRARARKGSEPLAAPVDAKPDPEVEAMLARVHAEDDDLDSAPSDDPDEGP